MALPKGIISKFEGVTKYDLTAYLQDYVDFVNRHYPNIVAFYSGKISRIDNKPFDILKDLLSRSNDLDDLVEANQNILSSTAAYWELLESLTDIKISLQTAVNARKWLRSSVVKGINGIGARSQTSLRFYQTLESLAKEVGATDKENTWLTVALENDLTEEQYTPEGGASVSTTGFGATGVSMNSVVDYDLMGEKVYGLDLDQKIQFNGTDDFVILSYFETLLQNTEILATLRKGQTPEFDEDGIQSSLVVGTNRASIAYPIILRQYRDTFSRDDLYKTIKVTEIKNELDSLSITLELTTVFGEPVKQQIVL